jgi:zinc ribbon protein
MNKINWTALAVITIVALLLFQVVASLLGGRGYGGYGYGGWGVMGPWMMGPFMMGGMFFMWLIPVGFLVLTVLGIAWIVRAVGGPSNSNTSGHTCPSCGRSVEADWKNCPHCGTALAK